jgi:deazaflavin-dependent oxidoreductase (nitroreductase family)
MPDGGASDSIAERLETREIMAPPKAVLHAINRIHIFLYRQTGGSVWGRMLGSPVLLLTTTGRRSGQPRTVPLVYTQQGGQYAVIATDNPAWQGNLRSNPRACIEVRGQQLEVIARDAAPEETARLWASLVEQSPAFARFSGKDLLVVLERV